MIFKAILHHQTQSMSEVEKYDSEADTLIHINTVAQFLLDAAEELAHRSQRHDASKLLSPEKELFDEWTPKLAGAEYGSEEYKSFLVGLKPALDHHYANNSHHPEYYENGINGMDLFDVIEMFCDWKAAVLRTKNGDITKSILINTARFKMSDQLADIFRNTVLRFPKPNSDANPELSVATKSNQGTER
jgi:hypothetical protein